MPLASMLFDMSNLLAIAILVGHPVTNSAKLFCIINVLPAKIL